MEMLLDYVKDSETQEEEDVLRCKALKAADYSRNSGHVIVM